MSSFNKTPPALDGSDAVFAPRDLPELVFQPAIESCAWFSFDDLCCVYGWSLLRELGAGEASDQLAPVDVRGAAPLTGAMQMASSLLLTCAALANGSAVCWGDNSYGQVGTGSSGGVQNLPVAVLGL